MITYKEYSSKLEELKNLDYIERDVIPENEPVFNVYLNTRKIVIPQGFNTKLALIGEHNAETIWFTLDRYFDGVDLAKPDKKWAIQFQNGSRKNLLPIDYKYVAEDELYGDNQQTDKNPSDKDKDEQTLKLGWKIHREVTEKEGTVSIALRCFTIEENDEGINEVTYDLKTEPINLTIGKSLNITDVSEGLPVPANRLEELVSIIQDLYENESAKELSYTELAPQSLPKIDGTTLLGNISSSEFDNISFNQLNDKPLINVDGTDYVIGVDTIKVTKVDVDAELKDSVNPVQNKVVNAKFTEIGTNISQVEETFDGKITDINDDLSELGKKIAAIEEELGTMTYIPLTITSFTTPITLVEKNTTLSGGITFNWAIDGIVASQSINLDGTNKTATIEDTDARTYTHDFGAINSDATFTLTAKDRKGIATSAQTKIEFAYKVFYGVAETLEEFQSTLGGNTGIIQKDAKTTFKVSPSETQYIFFAAPQEYEIESFSVGGFSGGFTQVATVNYNETDYNIWQSDNANLGNTTITVA